MSFLLSPLRNGVCSSLHLPSAGLTRNFSAAASFRVARMTVIGRLGTAPEVTLTKSGNEVIKYVLGASYGPPNDRQTSWFRIACFAPKSTIVWDKTLSIEKGSLVYVEADASMRSYENSEGHRQSQLSLVQTKVDILKRSSTSGSSSSSAEAPSSTGEPPSPAA